MDKKTKTKLNKELEGSACERTFELQVREADDDARTIEIAFSSETPVRRWFGDEVLDHAPGSMQLDRLLNSAPVLVNHRSDDQVGVVESARVDDDRKGRAVIRFSRSTRGEEIWQDVKDGIRRLVSVGYRVLDHKVKERDGQPDLVTMTRWEPYEVSLVPIPADQNVGVGRSADPELNPKEEIRVMDTNDTQQQETAAPTPPAKESQALSQREVDEQRRQARTEAKTEETRRINTIHQLADKYNLPDLGRQAVEEDWTIADFTGKALEKVGERNNEVRANSHHDGDLDLSERDQKEFSLFRLMEYLANPTSRKAAEKAAYEIEVSSEAQKPFGDEYQCRGEFIPPVALQAMHQLDGSVRTLSAGTATDGAELVATNLLAGRYIEVLRNSSALIGSGMQVIPGLVGNVEIPRQTSGAASTWVSAEDGDANESEPQFDQVTLSPKDLACYTEVTRRLFQQSTPAIEGIVRNDLAVAQALGIDYAGIYGSGTSGQPTGIVNQTGINTTDLAVADPTYAELVTIIKKVVAANALRGAPRWIIEAEGWEALMTTSKQASGVEGNFIITEQSNTIVGRPYTLSNQMTAEEYLFGDFSQLLMGEWGGLELMVDPYTHSLKGRVRYVTYKTVDVAVRQPRAFSYAHDGIV